MRLAEVLPTRPPNPPRRVRVEPTPVEDPITMTRAEFEEGMAVAI